MRYLGTALFAEGPTDHAFLHPLLRRLCEHLCASYGTAPVEIGDVLEIDALVPGRNDDLAKRIVEAARISSNAWNILFIHQDAGGDAEAARRDRVDPGCALIAEELSVQSARTVAVVPIRETEAWTIADGDALRQVFGTNLSNDALGLPSTPLDVERIADPKQVLEVAYGEAQKGRRSRRRRKASALLEPIGEAVRLDVLARVPAFAALQQELELALEALRYIRLPQPSISARPGSR